MHVDPLQTLMARELVKDLARQLQGEDLYDHQPYTGKGAFGLLF
jgi:hypothetical protein